MKMCAHFYFDGDPSQKDHHRTIDVPMVDVPTAERVLREKLRKEGNIYITKLKEGKCARKSTRSD
jgi:fatty acid desaturase